MNTTTQPPAADEAAHTPTPWHVSHNGNDDTRIFDAGSLITSPKCIAKVPVYLGRALECDANAAFICHACNSHAALVAALEELQAAEEAERNDTDGTKPRHKSASFKRLMNARNKAAAALAAARA